MLQRLNPALAAREARNLASLRPELQQSYAQAKQLYIQRHPHGNRPFLAYGHRTDEEQAQLYAQGRTKPGSIVTYKEPGQSLHNATPSRAYDVYFIDDHGNIDWSAAQAADFAACVQELNPKVEWGGAWRKFRDLWHFQL